MELIELKNRIITLFKGKEEELNEILDFTENEKSVYPFNEYELLIHTLIEQKSLTYQDYLEIRYEYIRRNPNLAYFDLVGRTFGNIMETYIHGICPTLKRPVGRTEYDFSLNNIRIEVKSGRVVEANSKKPLIEKALSSDTTANYDIILEQIKPAYCDVFIWIAVYRDKMSIWVLNSKEVEALPAYSNKQHRGNEGEGQFHIKPNNIASLEPYKEDTENLKEAIQRAYRRLYL